MVTKSAVEPAGMHTRVRYELELPPGDSKALIDYLVSNHGGLAAEVKVDVAKDQPMFPRLGMQAEMPALFRKWT